MTIPDETFEQAVASVWQIPSPSEPDNLLSAPAFVALGQVCRERYSTGNAPIALHNALRSLGAPCSLPASHAHLALNFRQAAASLDAAFRRRSAIRRHICPLDLADEIPPLAFGKARVAAFSVAELEGLFDAPRLRRLYPAQPLESQRLAQFRWLVVEEDIQLGSPPEARAVPVLFTDLSRDLGEIEPHLGRFPPTVERALFFLLLAEWEEWSMMKEVDWRGFRVPWIYTLDDDLFVQPLRPPNADSLSFEPHFFQDNDGNDVEIELPTRLPLDENAQAALSLYSDSAWQTLEAARASSVFATPIAHFLVRGFLADGIDEVMAHMTAIEAAMGLESDHKRKLRAKSDPRPRMHSTKRVAVRIAAALNDKQAARSFENLFDIRSAFIHGRPGLQRISTEERILARTLARRVACALVGEAARPSRSREDVLADLFDRGLRITNQ